MKTILFFGIIISIALLTIFTSCEKEEGPAIPVSNVSLNTLTLNLVTDSTELLLATILPEDATNKSVVWISTDTTVAMVNANGLVTAIRAGKTKIIATADQKSAKCVVTVTHPTIAVTGVTLNKTSLALFTGNKETLSTTIIPANADNKAVTWSSSNQNVATVSATGEVTAITAGTANITVTTTDGEKSANCTVTVTNPTITVTGVTLNKTSLALFSGNKETLSTTIIPVNADNKAVTWSSSNQNVATVSATGEVTAVAAGTANITATTIDGGKTANCTITVTNPTIAVTGVTLNKTNLTLLTGNKETLSATVTPANADNKTVTWSSSNQNVATVSATGEVTAVAAGTANITTTTIDGGKTANCTVTVTNPTIAVTGVTLNKTNLTLLTGNKETLSATVTPANADNKTVTWSSSNRNIATVSATGEVTAIAAGTANITVTTTDGEKSANCTVTVSATTPSFPVDVVRIEGGSLRIIGSVGNSYTLSSFYLSRTEITNQQFCDFLNSMNPIPISSYMEAVKTNGNRWFSENAQIEYNGRWKPKMVDVVGGNEYISLSNYPMVNVSWYGAKAYSEWVGGKLPTESQWEYAARGGEGNTTGYNQQFAGSNNTLDEVAWNQNNCNSNGSSKLDGNAGTHPVGLKSGNFLGLYDMSGNVSEWCSDFAYNQSPYPSGSTLNPQGVGSGDYHILRGGSWNSVPDFCGVSKDVRDLLWPQLMSPDLGFRVAFSAN